ncbi:MAG: Glyoxylate/hydroxypyruvate reductase B [Saezia sanguinis]|jgi:D-3-phosphoglycerate dehydrogenase
MTNYPFLSYRLLHFKAQLVDMNIVILDDYQDTIRKLACASRLEPFSAKVYTNNVKGISQLVFRLKDADILVLNHGRTQITRQILEKLPKLKLIIQIGLVGPHLDLDACTSSGIAVIEGHESPTATAEFTWALIMSAMRRLSQYVGMLKHGGWQQSGLKRAAMPANFALGCRLAGKTLGIWGYGRIGSLVAHYGKCFNMHVLVWGSDASRKKAADAGHDVAQSREELFKESDVLSLHLRLGENNRRIVKLDDLSLMKNTSLFVNTANAELVDTDALVCALNRGCPGLAAVDVFDSEPILQGHALLRLENTICTPHIGSVDQESYETHFCAAFDHIVNFTEGKPLPILNPQALQFRQIKG